MRPSGQDATSWWCSPQRAHSSGQVSGSLTFHDDDLFPFGSTAEARQAQIDRLRGAREQFTRELGLGHPGRRPRPVDRPVTATAPAPSATAPTVQED